MPNSNRSVGLNGINGDTASLAVTHTGTHPVLGKFFVSPGADADLVSVAELMKNGFRVALEDDYMVIDSPNRSTARAYINSANHYAMDRDVFQALSTPNVSVTVLPTYMAETTTAAAVSRRPVRRLSPRLVRRQHVRTATQRATAPLTASPVTAPTATASSTAAVAEMFTPEQRRRAAEVRHLHNVCGHPSDKTLTNALLNGLILGTPLTPRDVAAYRALFRCPACVAGKTTKPTYKPSTNTPAESVGEVWV